MLPQLIALDLDGTLLTSLGRVPRRTVRVLRTVRAQGARVVLCTGRPPRLVTELAAGLKLPDAVLAFNGAAVLDVASGSVEYRHQLGRDLVLEAVARLRAAHPAVMAGLETDHGWYLDAALWRQGRTTQTPDGCGDVCAFLRGSAVKVFFRHPELAAADLVGALGDLPVYATWSSAGLLEVMAKGVSKAEGLKYLCARLGVPRQGVAAFGDQHNDLEMLQWAGIGVAMGNAPASVKQVADLVTTSNNRAGVARILEQWLA